MNDPPKPITPKPAMPNPPTAITLKRGLFHGLFSAEARALVKWDDTTTVSVRGERELGHCSYICTVKYPVDKLPRGIDFISDISPVAQALIDVGRALGDTEDPRSIFRHQFIPLYEDKIR